MTRNLTLDSAYLRMLDELTRDSRISNAELAKRLNLSETAVRRRMTTLIKGDYVRVGAISDPRKLGYELQIWTGLRVQPEHVRRVVAALNACPDVCYLAIVSGRFDVVFSAWFRNTSDLRRFLTDDLGQIQGIDGSETFLMLEVLLGLRGEWRDLSSQPRVDPPDPRPALSEDGRQRPGRTINLDPIYLRMLEELSRNSRISHAELAKRLSISETAIRRRMSALLEGGYVKTGAVTNPAKLGFELQIWAGLRAQPGCVKSVVEKLNAQPEVNYLGLVTGGYDVLFSAWFRSLFELRTFQTERLADIQGIAGCDTFLILEVLMGLRGEWRDIASLPVARLREPKS